MGGLGCILFGVFVRLVVMVVGVVAEGFGAFGSLEVGEFGLMEFSHFPVEKFDLVE